MDSIFNQSGPTFDQLEAQLEEQRKAEVAAVDEQQKKQTSEAVPYDRFKEVNDDKAKYKALYEQLQGQLAAAQTQPQQQLQQVDNTPKTFYSAEELDDLEANIIVDPRNTINKITETILQRGVESRMKEVEGKFEQRLQEYVAQFGTVVQPMVLQNYKQQRFSHPSQKGVEQVFDKMVQEVSTTQPQILTNPQGLEQIRLAAVAYAYDNNLLSNTPQRPAQPFSESPSGGGFGGLLGNQGNTQVPPQVVQIAKQFGISEKEAMETYTAMERSGVFR